jgi:uncharacterized membrane protein YtjA (UPF0391 family)
MTRVAIGLLIVATVMGVYGFGGIDPRFASSSRALFPVFLMLSGLTLVRGRRAFDA